MERFLRRNAGVRWSLILLLVAGIALEYVLITYRDPIIASLTPPTLNNPPGTGGGDQPPGVTALACVVVSDVRLRGQPLIVEGNIIRVLSVGTPLTATGRSGDVPWLEVSTGTELGWVSSRDQDGVVLVECQGDLSQLPERTEISAADDEQEDVAQVATAEPTPIPAPDVRLREGNGPDLRVARRTLGITLDGILTAEEWGATSGVPISNVLFRPENWAGANDLNGIVRASWDEEFLYIAAQVVDDVIVQDNTGDRIYEGDAVEVYLDMNLEADFDDEGLSDDDTLAHFSPGNFAGNAPYFWVFQAPDRNDLTSSASLATTRTAIGYDIEIRLPWRALRLTPSAGTVLGYAIALDDNDNPGAPDQETQVTTSLELPYPNPTNWGNLFLDP